MKQDKQFWQWSRAFVLGAALCWPCIAAAQTTVPGPADVGRIQPGARPLAAPRTVDRHLAPAASGISFAPAPAAAKKIHLRLSKVHIKGMTAFAPGAMADIYAASLGRDITLDRVYQMADEISRRYRDAGYFLSRAQVPEQRVRDGVVTIQVMEGFVGRVDMPEAAEAEPVIRAYVAELVAQKPLTSDALESFLLRLNDLPGFGFSGVLSEQKGGEEGAVTLTLVAVPKGSRASISFDNASSRFLGPNEFFGSYSDSLLPMHQTTVSGLTSQSWRKLGYVGLDHAMVLAPNVSLLLSGSVTRAEPGYTLKTLDAQSDSFALGVSVAYQWIRQRRENLALKATLDSRNSATDLLGTAFTRDRIRAVRLNAAYDLTDRWFGMNTADVTLAQGIPGIGASHKGSANLSRAEATPDFTKLTVAFSRLQSLDASWSLLTAMQGQLASGPLYSSEEFGYGGQAFGRAYDSSELTGDHGVSGSIELLYQGYGNLEPVGLQPYLFYDAGVVWNDDAGQSRQATGSSAGGGIRFSTKWNQSGNLGLAWPLTRQSANPIYGSSVRGPRIMLQIGQRF